MMRWDLHWNWKTWRLSVQFIPRYRWGVGITWERQPYPGGDHFLLTLHCVAVYVYIRRITHTDYL